jgi:hypothetical protein
MAYDGVNGVADYGFTRQKLPRGLSYPVKRSILDAMLSGRPIGRISHVYYRRDAMQGVLLRSHFLGEDSHRGWMAAGASSLYIYAVASEVRTEAARLMCEQVVPRLISWLEELEAAGNTRRATPHEFTASWANGAVNVDAS